MQKIIYFGEKKRGNTQLYTFIHCILKHHANYLVFWNCASASWKKKPHSYWAISYKIEKLIARIIELLKFGMIKT